MKKNGRSLREIFGSKKPKIHEKVEKIEKIEKIIEKTKVIELRPNRTPRPGKSRNSSKIKSYEHFEFTLHSLRWRPSDDLEKILALKN